MSEISDLECYAVEAPPVENARAANGRKMTKRHGWKSSQRGRETYQKLLYEASRAPVTLPRVKWLERPDP